jgi:hypothetical protein
LSNQVSVPIIMSGFTLSITFDSLHSFDLIDWKFMFRIVNG